MGERIAVNEEILESLRGWITLEHAKLEGSRVRLRLDHPGHSGILAEEAVGPDGLFDLHYQPPADHGALRIDVLAADGEKIILSHAIPQSSLDDFLEIGPDGTRSLDSSQVLTPRPPTVYWRNNYPVAPEQVHLSQDATLRVYQAYGGGERGLSNAANLYPWRCQINPTTGLPSLLRSRLPSAPARDGATMAVGDAVRTEDFTSALFGVDLSGDFDRNFQFQTPIQMAVQGQGREMEQNNHFAWQQVYVASDGKKYPVLGGGFRVHSQSGSNAIAVTNSYFPVYEKNLFPVPSISDSDLFDIALRYLYLHSNAENAMRFLGARKELQWERSAPFLKRILSRIVAFLPGGQRGKRLAQSKRVLYRVQGEDEQEESYPLAILPCGGRYHLVARVRIALTENEVWYVDIDTHRRSSVGSPWQPIARAAYFVSSKDAATETPIGEFPNTELGVLHEPIPPLLDIPNDPVLERTTVAVHGQRFYTHLATVCGAEPLLARHIQNKHTFKVVLQSSESSFRYNPELEHKEIHLQQDLSGETVLFSEGLPIHHPGWDPELIIHELAHAFFWLLNDDPWQLPPTVTPFARALHEGYAIYLARSLAADLHQEHRDLPWASSVYRPEVWQDRWKLQRDSRIVGADLLRKPNNYPTSTFTSGQADIDFRFDYDIGMIWARALWDIRQLLGRDRTDYLAVQAYPYLHGAIVNLQTAAEALIEADARGNKHNVAAAVEPIWSIRGLISDLGVFGFAPGSDNRLYAGTDRGVRFFDGRGWIEDDAATPDGALASIESLAGMGERLFAVAIPPRNKQDGQVSSWNAGLFVRENGIWHSRPTPVDTTVLGVHVLEGQLLLATTEGVFADRAGDWQSLTKDTQPVSDMLEWTEENGSRWLISSLPARIGKIAFPPSADQEWIRFTLPNKSRPSALAVWKKHLYAGSLDKGLSRLQNSAHNFESVLESDSVLALVSSADRLIWSTPKGVSWKEWPSSATVNWADDSTLRSIALPCPAAMVVSLWADPSGNLVTGTLGHGIWRCDLAGNPPRWVAEWLPITSAQMQIDSQKEVLVSYFQAKEEPAAKIIDIAGEVTVEEVAQPGFPLRLLRPDSERRVSVEAGWIILRVRNHLAQPITITARTSGAGEILVERLPSIP